MAIIFPTGPLSAPLQNMRKFVANLPAFRNWVGATSDDEALDHIHAVVKEALPEEGDLKRPFVVIAWEQSSIRRGAYATGSLWMLFESAVPHALKSYPSDAAFDFMNKVGAVLAEMLKESEASGNPFIPSSGIDIVGPPQRSSVQEQEDYYQVAVIVPFGLESMP